MGFRGIIVWVILGSIGLSGYGRETFESEVSPNPRVGCFKTLFRLANKDLFRKKVPRWVEGLGLGVAFAFMGGTVATNLNYHHDLNAWVTGSNHLGYGIYLDIDGVLATFNDDERALLKDPEKNGEQIVQLLAERLEGDEDNTRLPSDEAGATGENRHWYNTDYFTGIKASHFFIHDGRLRGICKHKAVVLAAVLNQLGVEAKYQTVRIPNSKNAPSSFGYHVFVTIPKWDLVADPMKKVVMDRKKYERIFLTAPDEPLR